MNTMSKGTRILIILACVVTIIAMVFTATKKHLAPMAQRYVCEFCTDNALSPHPEIGLLLDEDITITHGTGTTTCTVTSAP